MTKNVTDDARLVYVFIWRTNLSRRPLRMATSLGILSYSYMLPRDAATRYLEKISMLSNVDPYIGQMPQVKLLDLIIYLVYTTSSLTQEEMRAHKRIQCYRYFINGVVYEVGATTIDGKVLLRGKVSSMPW